MCRNEVAIAAGGISTALAQRTAVAFAQAVLIDCKPTPAGAWAMSRPLADA